MKNIFIAAVFFVIALPGCKKDNDPFTPYVRGKVDGVAFECNTNITANKAEQVPGGPADPTLRITGGWSSNSINLYILSESSSLAGGDYVFQADKQRAATIRISGDAYYAGYGSPFLPPALHGSGKITLVEISSNYVRGNFEFTSEPYMGVVKTITGGEFYIKRN